ncbi:hypothetical protein H310_07327 [Aphanomyces invadans]|uniref:Uncharacterized protein n=1 Tax=Aphanomyces invadans TaxID=157072 RepID=A0A024U591_9STRA|nr:hypothetical protein H310_07327 [Aphanomyces invadans]ETW00793.1 hypothetical protein H310_07327 [Aphanomyces invadans]|eukprot:XP_008870928.1 hypothetical protein H310_07327 [Aphanomyces invadans]
MQIVERMLRRAMQTASLGQYLAAGAAILRITGMHIERFACAMDDVECFHSSMACDGAFENTRPFNHVAWTALFAAMFTWSSSGISNGDSLLVFRLAACLGMFQVNIL